MKIDFSEKHVLVTGGSGGIGIVNPISGSTTGESSGGSYYLGGGGGGGRSGITSGSGGIGGGGNGSSGTTGEAGTANTGGGGGGSYGSSGTGAGGSGVVIIKFATSGNTYSTSAGGKPTDVQDNSILVEKDTAKRYWASLDPTNTGFTGWTADSSGDAVTSNNIVTVTPNSNNSALQGVNYDIGTANIGSTWTLQFILDTTAWSNNSACDFRDAGIWVHDGVQNGDNVSCGISNTSCSGSANGKGFALKVCNGAGYKGYIDADISGTREIIPTRNASGTGYTYPSTTQGTGSDGRLGVRLMRLSSTAFRLEFWNNTDFSGSASVTYNTTATTLCGNITGLRYIMIGGYKQGSAGGSNTQAISELKFYNESITNPPVGNGTATWTQFGMNLIGLITGGYSTVEVNTVELFDGVSFYAGGQLLEARYNHFGGGDSSDALVGGGSTTAIYGASRTTESFNGTSWSSESLLNTGRHTLGGDGNSTDGICFQGLIGGSDQSITEEYNGTSWSTGGSANARRSVGGGGSSTDAITFGGYNGGNQANTQEYNGTAWSNGGSLASGTRELQGGGNSSHGVSIGGTTSSVVTTCATYNGSSWTSTGSLNTAQADQAGDGDETTAFSAGGSQGSKNNVESYNGTAWTDLTVLSTGRTQLKGGLKVS